MSAALRIGYDVTAFSQRAGIARYSRELLRALLETEPRHTYRLLSHARQRSAETQAQPSIRAPRHLRCPPLPNRSLWIQAVLPAGLAASSLDLVHFTNCQAPLATRLPTVVTLHDLSLLMAPSMHPRRRVLSMTPLLRAVTRRAAAVITPSHATRRDAIEHLDLDPPRVHVVSEAPSSDFRPATQREMDVVAAQYDLEPGFLLAIGTLEPRKNLSRLIDAYARLRRDGFSHPLVLCGARGWRLGPLLARVDADDVRGHVRLLGHVSDAHLRALLSLAGAFAYPSLLEGFGLPVIEALACGTPTVTSDRGATAEVAADAALLADPTDIAALTAAIARALFDPAVRQHLVAAGPKRAAEFSWRSAARHTLNVYESALARTA